MQFAIFDELNSIVKYILFLLVFLLVFYAQVAVIMTVFNEIKEQIIVN